jgi:uncharacterized protein YprB with RNaseH-like and TPR domain
VFDKLFQIFDHIGPGLEKKLWDEDVCNWMDVIEKPCPASFPIKTYSYLQGQIRNALSIIDTNEYHSLSKMIRPEFHWLLIPKVTDRIAYLDIETTGLYHLHDIITSIAVFDGTKIHNFINGENLNEFPEFIKQFPTIVTFYGKSFDVPFIQHKFNIVMPQLHYDTCFLLRKLGLKGGLKNVERSLGINRNDTKDIDGYMAVLLWQKYKKTNNRRYLETLVAYNDEDVLHLEFLLHYSYNNLLKHYGIDSEELKYPVKDIERPFHADRDIVEELYHPF